MSNIPSGPPPTGGISPFPEESHDAAKTELQNLRANEMEAPFPSEPKNAPEPSEEFSNLSHRFFAELFGTGNHPVSGEMVKGAGMATLLALKNAFDQIP
jgi:hypothetical protein